MKKNKTKQKKNGKFIKRPDLTVVTKRNGESERTNRVTPIKKYMCSKLAKSIKKQPVYPIRLLYSIMMYKGMKLKIHYFIAFNAK